MVTEATSESSGRAYPVILGAGLTGLAISRSLALAGIRHVLVGANPTDTPRLGESLNAEASVEIARQFPALERFFYDKQRQAIFFGKQAVATEFLRYEGKRAYLSPTGYPANVRMIHIERIGFDRALFDLAIGDDQCLFVEGRAAGLEVSRESGKIRSVKLETGRKVDCTYVFDATPGAGFLSPRMGLERTTIGERRRVVFAHYHLPDGAVGATDQAWSKTTSVLRMDRRYEAVDALAWCIPLGDYVSMGLSVDPAKTTAKPELLLNWLEMAYNSRGIDVRGAFPKRGQAVDSLYEHCNHAACHGPNWLLAGSSCCQFWFPTASGVAIGLLAARLAPQLLRDPLHGASLYQSYVHRIAAGHRNLDWLAHADPATETASSVEQRTRAMSMANVALFTDYVGAVDTPAGFAAGNALLDIYKNDRALASRFGAARTGAQAAILLTPSDALKPWMETPIALEVLHRPDDLGGPQAILALVDILSGKADKGRAPDLVTDDVKLQVDQFRLKGVKQWTSWIDRLLGSRRVTALQLVPGGLVQSGQDWVLSAQWRGTRGGSASISPAFSMTFQMSDDKIASLETHRADYVFVTGDALLPQVAYAAMLGRLVESSVA